MNSSSSKRRESKNSSVLKCKSKPQKTSIRFYEFFICNHQQNLKFKISSNSISTTKYNFITFFPKSCLLQFTRIANVYFLFIAILQSIPIISPLTSVTAIFPLVFVLCVSMFRDLLEDIKRYKYDKLNNSQLVSVLRENGWVTLQSQFLEAGDIITVNCNKAFPCDLILLDSPAKDGICYIETGTLDGENHLKTKYVSKETKGIFYDTEKECLKGFKDNKEVQGECTCDMPNPELYSFDGKLRLVYSNLTMDIPLTNHQLLLKGALLRQTKEIIGIVTYTGKNNKIILNAKTPKVKLSQLERRMNFLLIAVFTIQIILCITCSILHKKAETKNMAYYKAFIFQGREQYRNESVITFFTYILLLNTMIPISLIVTLEVVKVIQGLFIEYDCHLFSKVRKQFAKVNSVSIIEELGKVNYLFTDKTGTLTCNKMQFQYCVIGDQCYQYLREDCQKGINKAKEATIDDNVDPFTEKSLYPIIANQVKEFPLKQFSNNHMASFITQENVDCSIRTIIKEFWLALALANETICTVGEQKLEYSGVSPDDIELIKAAANQGFILQHSPNGIKKLLINTEEVEFVILNSMPFTSERKRMSIIVRTKDNKIKMYTKGADSEIKKRLGEKSQKEFEKMADSCSNFFSSQGYRTLFVAMKTLTINEYEEWSVKLKESELDLENKQYKVQECVNKMEQNYSLLGVSIVEDKLQDQVPETIQDLRTAGIKIWMLTGDKIDTAENISLSCNLISLKEKCFRICPLPRQRNKTLRKRSKTDQEVIQELTDFFNEFNEFEISYPKALPHFSILIESSVLGRIFHTKINTANFLEIALKAQSVICCRVSPLQKSQIIHEVKIFNHKLITLSIGDGGNDVSMIQEAHVGIGIYGEEGMLAVQSSDFAIGEFKYLKRLLFFHGRISLNRTSQMILYFFYKNFLFTILHLYFATYNLVSGQSLIDDWFITLYNVLFTSLPLGVQALSNFDVLDSDSKNTKALSPYLYQESIRYPVFSIISFAFYLFKALICSLITFYVVIRANIESPLNSEGQLGDIWFSSVNIYSSIIFVVSFSLIIKQLYFIWIFPSVLIITTFGFYYAFCFYVHCSQGFNSTAIIIPSFSSGQFYLCLLLISGACFILEFFLHSFSINFKNQISYKLLLNKRDNCNEIIQQRKRTTKAIFDISDSRGNFTPLEKERNSPFRAKLFSKQAYTVNMENNQMEKPISMNVNKPKLRNFGQNVDASNTRIQNTSIGCQQKGEMMKLYLFQDYN